jgi:hypothetical protein
LYAARHALLGHAYTIEYVKRESIGLSFSSTCLILCSTQEVSDLQVFKEMRASLVSELEATKATIADNEARHRAQLEDLEKKFVAARDKLEQEGRSISLLRPSHFSSVACAYTGSLAPSLDLFVRPHPFFCSGPADSALAQSVQGRGWPGIRPRV